MAAAVQLGPGVVALAASLNKEHGTHILISESTYQHVREGQPLFTIYSPDLVATEREYLVAVQNQERLLESTVPGVAAGAPANATRIAPTRIARIDRLPTPDSLFHAIGCPPLEATRRPCPGAITPPVS